MKKKVKIDKYSVDGKKRLYEILVFPARKYMWAYDPHPGEDFYMIDGNGEALRNLAIAFAILAEDPSKIIYFPIKKIENEEHFWDSFHLVLIRPELQFRHSEWFRLKGRLDKKHWTGKYVFPYDPQKLADYEKRDGHCHAGDVQHVCRQRAEPHPQADAVHGAVHAGHGGLPALPRDHARGARRDGCARRTAAHRCAGRYRLP